MLGPLASMSPKGRRGSIAGRVLHHERACSSSCFCRCCMTTTSIRNRCCRTPGLLFKGLPNADIDEGRTTLLVQTVMQQWLLLKSVADRPTLSFDCCFALPTRVKQAWPPFIVNVRTRHESYHRDTRA